MNPWTVTYKGDVRCRELADRHYTRQTPGHPMWTRPGYNLVLYFEDRVGAAVFCWWRPKWEAGQERKDGLRAIECTIFRNETSEMSSDLVYAACEALELDSDLLRSELKLDTIPEDGLITAVGSAATARRRSRHKRPGVCFREAGWRYFDHRKGRGDVWLCFGSDLHIRFPIADERRDTAAAAALACGHSIAESVAAANALVEALEGRYAEIPRLLSVLEGA